MSEAAAAADDRLDGVRADLAGKPDGVLETVAERHDVPLQAVLDCLPAAHASRVPGDRFGEIWRELTAWGEVMFLVHTRDGVFECRTRLPPGEEGRGYFNIHGPDSPLGGHLRADRCRWITSSTGLSSASAPARCNSSASTVTPAAKDFG